MRTCFSGLLCCGCCCCLIRCGCSCPNCSTVCWRSKTMRSRGASLKCFVVDGCIPSLSVRDVCCWARYRFGEFQSLVRLHFGYLCARSPSGGLCCCPCDLVCLLLALSCCSDVRWHLLNLFYPRHCLLRRCRWWDVRQRHHSSIRLRCGHLKRRRCCWKEGVNSSSRSHRCCRV